MPEVDLGELLRLRGMTDSAATSVTADGEGAPALIESYTRLRGLTREFVGANGLNIEEFDSAFPEIDAIDLRQFEHPRNRMHRKGMYAPQAIRAQALIGLLGGWLSGLFHEVTLERRLRLEAEERVKQERRQPPGFRSDS